MRLSKIGYQYDGVTAVDAAEGAGLEMHPSLDLWRRMRTCIAKIDAEINLRMREKFGISMPQFEVLKQLQKFADGLRMGELAQSLKVSGASITAFTDQLEQAELVLRVPDRVDRRVNSVLLTGAGRQLFVKAAVEYEGWVIELMGDMTFVANRVPAPVVSTAPVEAARQNRRTNRRGKNELAPVTA